MVSETPGKGQFRARENVIGTRSVSPSSCARPAQALLISP